MATVKTPCGTRFENTTMLEVRVDGVLKRYEIYPVEDYVIHDNDIDVVEYDEETGEEIRREHWYTDTYTMVRWDYDFDTNPNNIYAIPRSQANENCILGGNNHETI